MPGGASGQGKRHHESDWSLIPHSIPKRELVQQAPSRSALIGWLVFVLDGLVARPGTGSFLQRLLHCSVDTSTSFFHLLLRVLLVYRLLLVLSPLFNLRLSSVSHNAW